MGLIDRVMHLTEDRTTDQRRIVGGGLMALLAALGIAPRPEPARARGRRHGRNRKHHPGKHKDNRKGKRRDGQTLGSPACGQLVRYGCTKVADANGGSWQCPESVNLTNVDLSYCDLSNASLIKANLTGSNLTFASLRKANLTGATITGNLTTTLLLETILVGAKFTPRNISNVANLTNADFTHATVVVKDWTGVICADGFQARKGDSCCSHFVTGKGPDSCSV